MLDAAARALPPACRAVAVAYADWRRAGAPLPKDVCTFACERSCGAFLLDTWQKDGKSLLDSLSIKEIAELICRCADARIPIAVAGSP